MLIKVECNAAFKSKKLHTNLMLLLNFLFWLHCAICARRYA